MVRHAILCCYAIFCRHDADAFADGCLFRHYADAMPPRHMMPHAAPL